MIITITFTNRPSSREFDKLFDSGFNFGHKFNNKQPGTFCAHYSVIRENVAKEIQKLNDSVKVEVA